MSRLVDDQLVNYTRSRISNKGTLTYSYQKGALPSYYRSLADRLLNEIDERLDGVSFKRIKPSAKADIIINNGELPPGAAGAVVWTDVRWELRLPERGFSTTTFRHEVGHLLGLNHVPMGTNSLMQPQYGGVGDFTKKDWRALESIWGA